MPTIVGSQLLSVPTILFFAGAPVTFRAIWREVRAFRWLVGGCLLYVIAQACSNIRAGLGPDRILLAAWQPNLILVAGTGFWWLLAREQFPVVKLIRITLVAQIIFVVLSAPPSSLADAWKYGVGVPVTLLACSYLLHVQVRLAFIGLVILVAVSVVLGYRALAASCLVAAVLLLMVRAGSVRRGTLVKATAAVAVAMLLAGFGYPTLASRGALGAAQKAKYESQAASGSALGLLISARPELFASIIAVRGQPLLGRGSVPQLTLPEQAQVIQLAARAGAPYNDSDVVRILAQDRLNSHSLLFSSLVAAGIAGALPWLLFAWLLARACLMSSGPQGSVGLRPLLMVGSSQYGWDMFFSPWSAHYEILLGVLVGVALRLAQVRSLTEPG